MCFNGILKENVPLTVSDWMRYACLVANSLLSAFAAVVCLYTTIGWDPEPLKSHPGILADHAW